MHPVDAHRALVERYLAAYNALDVPGMLETLHADVTFENLSGGRVTVRADGIDEFRALAEHAVTLFASRRQTMRRYAASEEGATIDVDYEGVLATDLGPAMRAGETIRLRGRSRFTFRDGRIAGIVDES